MITAMRVHCPVCGRLFIQYDYGKGTPKKYCDNVCRSRAHRTRNLANREARKQAGSSVVGGAYEQTK